MTLSVLFYLFPVTPLLAQTPNNQNRATAVANYTLQVGDVLNILIWGWPVPGEQLEGKFPIESSGRAFLPVVGAVEVAGKTTERVQAELRQKFASEQSQAVIVVEPLFAVAVNGEVRQPGVYDFRPGQTVFDALSRAGGYTPNADRDDVLLVRAGKSENLSAGSPNELATRLAETVLQSGDRLLVHPDKSPKLTTIYYIMQTAIAAITLFTVLK